MKQSLVIVGCIVMLGCARLTVYDIHEIGPETYSVSASASTIAGGSAGAERAAVQSASEYCQKRKQHLKLMQVNYQGGFPDRSTSIRFQCY